MVEVSRLTKGSASAARELAALASVLHEDHRTMSAARLQELLADKNIVLVVARDGERIVGMGTLYVIAKIGKSNAYIEDVIVDAKYRGQGLGEKVVRKLISLAKQNGVRSVSLTSRSHRVAAHKLYTKLGFKIVETNVFKLSL